MTRAAIPVTVTSTGHVSQDAPLVAGPAEALHGIPRYLELHTRLRQKYARLDAALLLITAWRHGFVLSGSPIRRRLP